MKFNINYYFEKIEKQEIFYTLVQDKEDALEIFDASLELIDKKMLK